MTQRKAATLAIYSALPLTPVPPQAYPGPLLVIPTVPRLPNLLVRCRDFTLQRFQPARPSNQRPLALPERGLPLNGLPTGGWHLLFAGDVVRPTGACEGCVAYVTYVCTVRGTYLCLPVAGCYIQHSLCPCGPAAGRSSFRGEGLTVVTVGSALLSCTIPYTQ